MNWTVGKRITVGFSVILILLGITTMMSYFKIDNIAYLSKLSTDSLEMDNFLVEKEIDHLNWMASLSHSIVANKEIKVGADPHKCGFGKWLYKALEEKNLPQSILAILEEIEPIHRKLHETVKHIKKNFVIYDTSMDKTLDDIWIGHLEWMDDMNDSLLFHHVFTGQTNYRKCAFGKWVSSFKTDDPKLQGLIEDWKEPHRKLHQAAVKIVKLQKAGDYAGAMAIFKKDITKYFDQVKDAHKQSEHYLHELSVHVHKSKKIFEEETTPVVEHLRKKIKHLRKTFDEILVNEVGNAVKDIAGTAHFAKLFMLIFGALATIIGIVLSIVITRSIVKPMTRIGQSLDTISNNVGAASTELSDASQQLSSMSSEQASSVEETSSSLEEIEGMVQNNISHAQESVNLANQVKELASEGNQVMERLEKAMHDILDSNNKIGELVKVIGDIGEKTKVMDEIVFQTKLLSFNASVEAERAGEHGRGFAVVAQEVGNLAQMSGKSAQEIAKIVNESVQNAEAIIKENQARVETGGALVTQMNESLKQIVEGSTTVSKGASGVLDASTDQGKGIKQINIAMVEIDKVTQETAATAEETASASEELAAQVDSLREIVQDLTMLVSGNKSDSVTKSPTNRVSPSNKTRAVNTVSSSSDGWDEL